MSSYTDRLKKTIELRKARAKAQPPAAGNVDKLQEIIDADPAAKSTIESIIDLFGPCDITVEEVEVEILTEREVLILVTVFNRWHDKLIRAEAFMSSPRIPEVTKVKHAAEHEQLIKDEAWLHRTLDDIYFEFYAEYGITLSEDNAGFIKPQRERRKAA